MPRGLDNIVRLMKHDGARALYAVQSYFHAFSNYASNSFLNHQLSDLNVFQALLLLTVLIVSWKILTFAINQIVGWILFFLRLTMFTVTIASGWYIYTFGLEAFLRNLGWIVGLVDGFLVDGGKPGKREKNWYSGI